MLQPLIDFVRDHYHTNDFIPLHVPVFGGNEKAYVAETIDSTFVSSVGAFVDRFEQDMAAYTGSPRAVATVNGTAALHVALRLVDVGPSDYVITQPLTFVATCNAIAYCGAMPIFVDVDRHTLGLSPKALAEWLEAHAYRDDRGLCRRREGNGVIRACLPMHTFGHPADLDGLLRVCTDWGLALVEDAAESLGSTYHGRHTGTVGDVGTLSFNGNKVITTGGGGMILADQALGKRAKHLTTTAKQPHVYEYVHDELGYNYRLPNLNAALGCAQLEQLDAYLTEKRQLAADYAACLAGSDVTFVTEPAGCRSNYWLNAVICTDHEQRDQLLKATNEQGIMTRPIWQLMNRLPMYNHAPAGELSNALWLEARVVNLPSGIRAGEEELG
ncbi:aminotransferase, LLPSF_NHT_00031 family [Modicisalibacter ilicicola DSM 19980]|uniref:GDP-perosamine synthase n=1 Tax=Modicisalibacter ilicicola DSM 19980 TaxID=1121942 RepID=A0A1M5EPL5_9GAMM|nr:LegC family aminotransferase [Halomonas ilicicola]SHF80972.1 aminotransferase, LLPSF_NHT_00031 family [Halomonas ilicicola DSM 19980]